MCKERGERSVSLVQWNSFTCSPFIFWVLAVAEALTHSQSLHPAAPWIPNPRLRSQRSAPARTEKAQSRPQQLRFAPHQLNFDEIILMNCLGREKAPLTVHLLLINRLLFPPLAQHFRAASRYYVFKQKLEKKLKGGEEKQAESLSIFPLLPLFFDHKWLSWLGIFMT